MALVTLLYSRITHNIEQLLSNLSYYMCQDSSLIVIVATLAS